MSRTTTAAVVSLLGLGLLLAPARALCWSSAELVATGDSASGPGAAQVAWQRARLVDADATGDRPLAEVPTAPLLPAQEWAWLLWGGLALTATGAGALVLTRRRTALALAVVGATTVTGAALALNQAAAVRELAIVSQEATVRVSPASTAPEQELLPEGAVVRVDDQREGWAHVAAGWVDEDALEVLVPE